jgi:hypothetical protein
MRQLIKHPHADDEERTVTKFLFLPTTLLLPKHQRDDYVKRERRWLEKAKIVQRYFQWLDKWIDFMWAEDSKKEGRK